MNGDKLGIWFAPGTFPTYTVLEKISVTYPHIAEKWSREKVNALYFAYKEGVLEKGLAVWPERQGEIAGYIRETTGYGRDDVSIFLMTLQEMAGAGEIDPKWFDIEAQRNDPPVVENVIRNIQTGAVIEKAKIIKQIGIIALIGIGVYLTWPLLSGMRKQRG